MLYLVLMHFIVDLAQKWLREKTFYYILLHFIVDFARAAWLWGQIFDFIFLFSIDFSYASDCGCRYLRFFNCNNMPFFCRNLWQYQTQQPNKKVPAASCKRRRRNKAYSGESIGRPTSPHTSVFLGAIFSRDGRKIYKISSKNNPSVELFQVLNAIIISMAKKQQEFDRMALSLHTMAESWISPWPTENLNFAPRMCMLNWRPSPFTYFNIDLWAIDCWSRCFRLV